MKLVIIINQKREKRRKNGIMIIKDYIYIYNENFKNDFNIYKLEIKFM